MREDTSAPDGTVPRRSTGPFHSPLGAGADLLGIEALDHIVLGHTAGPAWPARTAGRTQDR